MRKPCTAAFITGLLLAPAIAQAQSDSADESTLIYFVRHAEVDVRDPTFPLNVAGLQKAEAFARSVSAVRFTHVFSSHTTRARQMVEPVALSSSLTVQQLPGQGVQPDGTVISDSTSSRVAIAPLVRALRELAPGSRALVGVNSDNVYSILNGLGVPAATVERPCERGDNCVPCLTKACASPLYDQLWLLVVNGSSARPTLIELRYGDTRSAAAPVPSADSLEQWIRRGYSLTATDGKTPQMSDEVREVWGELGWSGTGFGFRTLSARKPPQGASADEGIKSFAALMDHFTIRLDELHTEIVGDIGLVWGVHTEEFKMKGRQPEAVRVRFTNTLRWDGQRWKNLLYHRDAQKFDDKGWYIGVPTR